MNRSVKRHATTFYQREQLRQAMARESARESAQRALEERFSNESAHYERWAVAMAEAAARRGSE